jgi:hypothetical protein
MLSLPPFHWHLPEVNEGLDLSNLDEEPVHSSSTWTSLKYLIAERHCLRVSKNGAKA